jgi:PilZ domain
VQNPENRRAHPRIELVATVEVAAGGDDLIVLTATNLSMGGVFLEANPSDYPVFRRGVIVDLSISLADSASVDDKSGGHAPPPPQVVRAKGKIVRIQMPAPDTPSGYGIVITDLPPSEVPRLHALLARAPASKGRK